MKCYQPILIKQNPKSENYNPKKPDVVVPCGKCMACKQQKAREYTIRFEKATYKNKYRIFGTLTYDDENITADYGLDKEEIVKYLKRVQKEANKKGIKYKYYLTGEYGEENGRPHYHVVIGCDEKRIADIFNEKWGKGKTEFEECDTRGVMYVIGYVDKKVYGYNMYGKRQAPFRKFSGGLGKEWLEENKEKILKDMCITKQGIPYAIPKYYKNKLKEKGIWDEEAEIKRAIEEKEKLYKYLNEKYGKSGIYKTWNDEGTDTIERSDEAYAMEAKILQQRKLIYEQKANIFRKNRNKL